MATKLKTSRFPLAVRNNNKLLVVRPYYLKLLLLPSKTIVLCSVCKVSWTPPSRLAAPRRVIRVRLFRRLPLTGTTGTTGAATATHYFHYQTSRPPMSIKIPLVVDQTDLTKSEN